MFCVFNYTSKQTDTGEKDKKHLTALLRQVQFSCLQRLTDPLRLLFQFENK